MVKWCQHPDFFAKRWWISCISEVSGEMDVEGLRVAAKDAHRIRSEMVRANSNTLLRRRTIRTDNSWLYIYFHKLGVSNLLPFTVELRSVDLSVVPGRLLKGKTMRTHGFLNITCQFFLKQQQRSRRSDTQNFDFYHSDLRFLTFEHLMWIGTQRWPHFSRFDKKLRDFWILIPFDLD